MVEKCENQAGNRNQDHRNKQHIYPQTFAWVPYLKPDDLHTNTSRIRILPTGRI